MYSTRKEVKMITRKRYVMLSSDYSQQEPKLLAQLSGDKDLLDVFERGEDIYATVAAAAFETTYENCLEFFPEGTPLKQIDVNAYEIVPKENAEIFADGKTNVNPSGKERRSGAKTILLGILYGRSDESVAKQLGSTLEEAHKIKANIYKRFPGILRFEQESERMARDLGYVTTLWGRKRRLPDLNLPPVSVIYKGSKVPVNSYDAQNIAEHYVSLRWKSQKDGYIRELNKQGIILRDNSGFIARAKRQIVNSRIQGSASDQSKKAMLKVDNDKEFKKLGGELIMSIHDELLSRIPLRNLEKGAERFKYLMETAADDKLRFTVKCDITESFVWYGEQVDREKELGGLDAS